MSIFFVIYRSPFADSHFSYFCPIDEPSLPHPGCSELATADLVPPPAIHAGNSFPPVGFLKRSPNRGATL